MPEVDPAPRFLLGIETSCDETAAAVLHDGARILSSVVFSQIDLHHRYGGVVPELASRKHIEAIAPVVRDALEQAGLEFSGLDAIAVTRGPGLIGSLLVGFSYAKALAFALNLPWIGVHHLEAHVHSIFLQPSPPPFPFIALLVSGGHTNIYRVDDYLEMALLGQTRDDAAGEAYDKVSKMLALGYPGGTVIDKLARSGDPARIHFPRAYLEKNELDFSFSGIKTAVQRYIQTHPQAYQNELADIAAGFQEAVVDVLSFKAVTACLQNDCRHLALVGGVAANSRLRERIRAEASREGVAVHLPPLELCGDNAAMVAAAGYRRLQAGQRSEMGEDVFSRILR